METRTTDQTQVTAQSSRPYLVYLLIGVLLFVLGVAAGYYFSSQKTEDKLAAKDKQIAELQSDSGPNVTQLTEKKYINSRLGFSLEIPESWLNQSYSVDDKSFTTFAFKTGGGSYAAAFYIYSCSSKDYNETKGKTDDVNKCPGDFIKEGSGVTYTWLKNEENQSLTAELVDTNKVTEEFKTVVLPTFQTL